MSKLFMLLLAGCVVAVAGVAPCSSRTTVTSCSNLSACRWNGITAKCVFKSDWDRWCFNQGICGYSCKSVWSSEGSYCAPTGSCPDPDAGYTACTQAGCDYDGTYPATCTTDLGLAGAVIAVIVLACLCAPICIGVAVCFFCGFMCFSNRRTVVVQQQPALVTAQVPTYATIPQEQYAQPQYPQPPPKYP